jgi:hypothetical protein
MLAPGTAIPNLSGRLFAPLCQHLSHELHLCRFPTISTFIRNVLCLGHRTLLHMRKREISSPEVVSPPGKLRIERDSCGQLVRLIKDTEKTNVSQDGSASATEALHFVNKSSTPRETSCKNGGQGLFSLRAESRLRERDLRQFVSR